MGERIGPGAFRGESSLSPSFLVHRELVQRAAEIVNTSLSPGSGRSPRCIDHFSITGPPDNAARLASKYRVDYLSTDRLTELQNSRDSGPLVRLFISERDGAWLFVGCSAK